MRWLLIFSLNIIFITAFSQEKEIRTILDEQVACWNKGDLECFMKGYVESDELVFVGSSGPRYGWQVTLNSYKRSYPNRDAMGTLKMEVLKFKSLGKNFHMVIGKWVLTREMDTPQGHFTLIFEKINGKWKIIADHSS